MEFAISITDLTKNFGNFTAVDKVNLDIKPGEVCAFLGPNGAGKTTVIRMLCGILQPSSGFGSVLGYDLLKETESIKQNLGYMSQKFSLYVDLTVIENLNFYAGIYRIDKKTRKKRIEEMLHLAGLEQNQNQLVKVLSQGFKQRLALACAVISNPAVIFLDEPTSGVSPTARRSFFNLIQEQAANGKTIIVSTHFMDEAERCGKIAFFNEGRLLALDNPDKLKKDVIKGYIYRIEVDNPVAVLEKINDLPGILNANLYGRALHVNLGYQDDQATLYEYTGTVPELIEPTLEDVFLTLAGKRGGRLDGENTRRN
jgi:ABC-2 type transport system ATP-binding protein